MPMVISVTIGIKKRVTIYCLGSTKNKFLAVPQMKIIRQEFRKIRQDFFQDPFPSTTDSLDKNPAGYKDGLAAFDIRIRENLRRGQRMVSLGLLTEEQAAV